MSTVQIAPARNDSSSRIIIHTDASSDQPTTYGSTDSSSSASSASNSGTGGTSHAADVANASVPDDTARVQPAVQRLRDLFRTGVTKPLEWRLGALRALRAVLVDTKKEIEAALWSDLRKSAFDVFLCEWNFCIAEIDEALHHLKSWMKPRAVNTNLLNLPGSSELRRDPLGVVLIIAPFNYPFQLAISPLIGALAAGNCCVLKPSELAAHFSLWCGRSLAPAMAKYGVEVIQGGIPPTQALLKLEHQLIFYTGGGNVAKIIMRAAAEFLTPTILELGGKSPCLVLDDANIETAARRIAWGKTLNAGQTCIAPDYLLVDERVHDELVAKLRERVREMYGANPADSDDYGRIINENHCKRLAALVQPIEEGVTAAIGSPNEIDIATRYFPPLFLTGVKPEHRVMQDELFGPILPIIKISAGAGKDALDAMLEFVNARPKPLAAYIFTESEGHTQRFLNETSSGGVSVNDCMMHIVNTSLPFGGVGPSGMGSYHGEKSFEVFSHTKSVLKRPGATLLDAPQRYAPYTPAKAAFMQRMLRIQALALYKRYWYVLAGTGAGIALLLLLLKFAGRVW